ncbi:MAG: sulfatase-like hydrolase/transferase [Myxococcales bacterium]|nr:sulfatase-like hydrolase/transferase [Myxococcales bacterium]
MTGRAVLALVGGTLLALGVWLATSPTWVTVPRAPQYNVLLVVWDTVRADRMSLYGHGRLTTPRVDGHAEHAVVFERASSPGIWTLPAHASMFTGLPPETTGADERWLWLDGHHLTMAEHFRDQGYGTFSLAANALLCAETNLVQGFRVPWNTFRGRVAERSREATADKLIAGDRSQELSADWVPPDHGATNAEWARAAFKDAAPVVVDTFLTWLDVRKDRGAPFFAYLNLMEAHTPRIPSMEARRAVIADPDLVDLGLATDAAHIRLHFYNFGKQAYSDRELQAINAVYDATLWDLDRATSDLLEALRRRGLMDSTIVVLTSDHGENLGDHGLFNHRFSLWDSLVHVPLVIWHPDWAPARVATPVTTQDLFPTLARRAQVPVPEGLSADLLTDPSPAVTSLALPLRREIETVQAVHPDVAIEPWLRAGHALVRDGHKLMVWSDGPTEVFDLEADPAELVPLEAPDVQASLARVLDEHLSAVRPYDPDLRDAEDEPAHVRASQEELRSHLRALGYTTDDD